MAIASIDWDRAAGPGSRLVVVDGGKAALDERQLLGIEVGDRGEFDAGEFGEIPNEVGPPIAVTDDAYVDH